MNEQKQLADKVAELEKKVNVLAEGAIQSSGFVLFSPPLQDSTNALGVCTESLLIHNLKAENPDFINQMEEINKAHTKTAYTASEVSPKQDLKFDVEIATKRVITIPKGVCQLLKRLITFS